MTKEEADQIAEFGCDECAPTFRISDDKEKGYFIPCEKHKNIANLNYFKKMNTHSGFFIWLKETQFIKKDIV